MSCIVGEPGKHMPLSNSWTECFFADFVAVSCRVKFRQVGDPVNHMVAIASFFHPVSFPTDTSPPPPTPAKMRDDLDVNEVCVFYDLEGKITCVSRNCMVQGK